MHPQDLNMSLSRDRHTRHASEKATGKPVEPTKSHRRW